MASIFAQYARRYIEHGISVIPIAPNSKKPGAWDAQRGWAGMGDWTRFAKRLPTEIELDCWDAWPDAGIGLVLGEVSGLVAVDRDYDLPGLTDSLNALIPWSPLSKKGEKGFNRFFRYTPACEKSQSFDVQGKRVLDILTNGRQTVLPPTPHPSGCTYVWTGKLPLLEFLDEVGLEAIPELPADFVQQIEKLIAPFQSQQDVQHQRKFTAPREDSQPISIELSIQAEYFRDINRAALADLEAWVPKLVPDAKPSRDGYRAIARWRAAENPNVGITPQGIRDWGGNYGMTPIDLVMAAQNLSFSQAVDCLRACVHMTEPELITFQPRAPAPAVAPALMPWQIGKVATPAVFLPPETSQKAAPAIPSFILNPPGILGDIVRWTLDSAPKYQPELALAGAIAAASACTQRIYRTNRGNFSNLYLLMICLSTEGKEHPQNAVQRLLAAADLGHLLIGSGYTSAGSVFSALLQQPAHLAIIDEMGKLLKLSRANGNANGEAAIDKLVEAFGRADGIMRPPVYSTMTLSRQQAADQQPHARIIHKPAISFLGAATAATFYGALTDDLVSDGFLGRLLVIESTQPRQFLRLVDPVEPPEHILEWCRRVNAPPEREGNLASQPMADIAPTTVRVEFAAGCDDMVHAFDVELMAVKEAHTLESLDVLVGRTLEKAMRLSLIAALAEDPAARVIQPHHMEWGIQLARHLDIKLLESVSHKRKMGKFDEQMKRMTDYVSGARSLGKDKKHGRNKAVLEQGWMPHSMLLKRMKMTAREFQQLIDTAIAARCIETANTSDIGYAGNCYRVLDAD